MKVVCICKAAQIFGVCPGFRQSTLSDVLKIILFLPLGRHPTRPRPNLFNFVFKRFTGAWGFRFPKVSFKFVIRNRKIHIGKTLIKLKPSTNLKYKGWFTFVYRRITYYIRFTLGGVRIIYLHGKKPVTGRVTRPHKKPGMYNTVRLLAFDYLFIEPVATNL